MKLLFDFFPILLFFLAYKIYGIYAATAVAMGASLVQVIFYRLKHNTYEKMHLISLVLIFVLGGATLFFHNPWFIKWKPTGIYWLMATVLFLSPFFSKRTLVEKMMDDNIDLPKTVWKKLNIAWGVFFIIMGGLNIFIAYTYSTDTWVNFKLFGGAGLTIVFILVQAVYLAKHMSKPRDKKRRATGT